MDLGQHQPDPPMRIVEDIQIAAGWAGMLPDAESVCVVDSRLAADQAIRDHVIDSLEEIGCPYPGQRLLPTG